MKKLLGAAMAAGVLTLSPAALAQQASSGSAAMVAPDPSPAPADAPQLQFPRFGRSTEHSVGFRSWMFIVPSWMVGLFANVNPEWSGVLSAAVGPEYVFRRGGLDVVLSIQYTGLGADAGFFRGKSEGDIANERVQSSLWGLYVNALFLWHHRFNDWFELQYGAGVGLGYVGGDLFRTQVYANGGGYTECDARPPPGGTPGFITHGGYCDTANNHYVYSDGSRYSEGRLTDTSGSIPPVIPWISLPHLALHFRPHRNIDVRVDGGFALIGFYTGLAAHYVF